MEQVEQQLTQPLRITPDRRQRSLRQLQAYLDSLAICERPQARRSGCQEWPDGDVIEMQLRGSLFDTRQVKQLVDHLDQVAGLDVDGRHPFPHPIGHVQRGQFKRG